jgi:cytohesin
MRSPLSKNIQAFTQAAQAGDVAQLRALLDAGTPVDARDQQGFTALMRAALGGQLDAFAALLAAGADPHAPQQPGWNLLMCALSGGNAEVVRLLIEQGVDLNTPNDRGSKPTPLQPTPLMAAVEEGALPIVRLLVEAGADLHHRRGDGQTALSLAEQPGRKRIREILRQARDRQGGWTHSLHEAAQEGDVPTIRRLLGEGATVDRRDNLGRTPLMLAAHAGAQEAFETLRAAGADPWLEPHPGGTTLLHWAAWGGHADIVRAVLQAGADVNAAVHNELGDGYTPLMTATAFGRCAAARLLLEAGADPRAATRSGETALEIARRTQQRKLVKLLEEASGARPATRTFKTASEEPAFQQALRRLADLCGREPTPYKRRKGVHCLFLNPRNVRTLAERLGMDAPFPAGNEREQRQVEQLLERLRAEMRAAGYCLIQGDAGLSADVIMLLLFPTNDQYAVVAARGTNANRMTTVNGVPTFIGPSEIISWLKELEKTHPFELTGCGFDFLAGKFLQPVADAPDLAERMFAFCPDIVDQGTGTVEGLARELEQRRDFFFWWD